VKKIEIITSEIRKIANTLYKEADDVSDKLSKYRTLLHRFEQHRKDPDNTSAIRFLNPLNILFSNIKEQKSRNSLVMEIQSSIDTIHESEQRNEKAEKAIFSSDSLINNMRKILIRYKEKFEKYPAANLLKDVLDFGISYNISQFIDLFIMPSKFKTKFSTQNEQKIKQKIDEKTSSVKINFNELGKNFDKINKKIKDNKISKLSVSELRELYAYESWKDGAEKDTINEILNSNEPTYKNKFDLIKNLEVYNYKS
jgi:hypothetical protein